MSYLKTMCWGLCLVMGSGFTSVTHAAPTPRTLVDCSAAATDDTEVCAKAHGPSCVEAVHYGINAFVEAHGHNLVRIQILTLVENESYEAQYNVDKDSVGFTIAQTVDVTTANGECRLSQIRAH